MKYYLYRHTRLDNDEVFYIGIGQKRSRSYKSYKDEYYRAYYKSRRSKFWKNIVSKTEYKVEILFECDSVSDIYNKEKEFIKLYGRRDLNVGTLCNLTDGGDGTHGYKFTEKQRERSKEVNKSTSLIRGNKTRHFLYQYNAETGEFIREVHGKTIVSRQLGLTRTTLSTCSKTKSKYAYGYLWYPSYVGEKVEPFNGVVRKYTGIIMIDTKTNEELIEFTNIAEAFKYLGKKRSGHIRRACREGITSYGYKWKEATL